MRLLIDTNVLLWWLEDNPKLGTKARVAIAEPSNEVWVSVAATWEIVVKHALGRLELAEPMEELLPREFAANRFRVVPITLSHTLLVGQLPPHHADPFDRVMVAQAIHEGMTMLSSDEQLTRYQVAVLDARR